MKVVDLHSDLFTDIAWRREKGESHVLERIHLPKLQKGGVSGLIGVFWVEPIYTVNKKARFARLVHHVLADIHESTKCKIVTSPEEMLATTKEGKFFIYLGLEGLSFLEEWPGRNGKEKIETAVSAFEQIQIGHAIFNWNDANFIATGTGNPENDHSGLTESGVFAVKELEERQWIIDVSHLDEKSFWDVIHSSNSPIMASHSNAQKLCPHERNLTDEQLKAIAKTGGLIGVNAYGSFVHPEKPHLTHVVDHLVYIADLIGPEHLGFGFDFVDYLQVYDLGDDLSNMTKGLEDATKIPDLLNEMAKRGFSKREIERIAFENFYHFLSKIHSLNTIGGQL